MTVTFVLLVTGLLLAAGLGWLIAGLRRMFAATDLAERHHDDYR